MAKADQDLLASGGRLLAQHAYTHQTAGGQFLNRGDLGHGCLPLEPGPHFPSGLDAGLGLGGAISVTCAYPYWINDMAWHSRSLIATLRYVPCLFNQQKIQAIEV